MTSDQHPKITSVSSKKHTSTFFYKPFVKELFIVNLSLFFVSSVGALLHVEQLMLLWYVAVGTSLLSVFYVFIRGTLDAFHKQKWSFVYAALLLFVICFLVGLGTCMFNLTSGSGGQV